MFAANFQLKSGLCDIVLLSKYIVKGAQIIIRNLWNEDEASAIRATSFCSSIVILFAINSTRHGNGCSDIFYIISAFLAEGFFSHDGSSLIAAWLWYNAYLLRHIIALLKSLLILFLQIIFLHRFSNNFHPSHFLQYHYAHLLAFSSQHLSSYDYRYFQSNGRKYLHNLFDG